MMEQRFCVVGVGAIESQSFPLGPPGEGQVLIDTCWSAVSKGTERMWFEGSAGALRTGRKTFPYYPGYSAIGKVRSVGAGVSSICVGDYLYTLKGHASAHLVSVADEFVLALGQAPPRLDYLLVNLLATALNATRRAQAQIGDRCAVIGAGQVGALIAKLMLHITQMPVAVSVTDPDAYRDFFAIDGIEHLTDDMADSFDCVVDASGLSAGLAAALRAVRPAGCLVGAGFYTDPILIDGEAAFAKEVDFRAVRAGGRAGAPTERDTWTRSHNLEIAADLVARDRIGLAGIAMTRSPARKFAAHYAEALGPTNKGMVVVDWTD